MKAGFQSFDSSFSSEYEGDGNDTPTHSLNLKKENIKYRKENQTLQAQFDDMNKINEQITQMQKDNIKVVKENSALRLENEELKQKISILYEQITSLKQQLSDAKSGKGKSLASELSEMQGKIAKERLENERKLNSLNETVNSLQQKIESSEVETNSVKNTLQLLQAAAENFIDTKFQSLDSLISFLNENKAPSKNANATSALEEIIRTQKKQIKELKKIVQKETSERDEIEVENNDLKLALSQQKSAYETKLKDQEKQLTDMEYSLKLQDHQAKAEKDTLEKQIMMLKDKIASQSQKFDERSLNSQCDANQKKIESLQSQLASALNKATTARASIVELTHQIEEQQTQIRLLKDSNDKLQSKVEQGKREAKEYKSKQEEMKKEIQDLKVSNALLEENVHSASTQVQAAKATFAQSQYAFHEEEATIETQKNAIQRLEKLIADQKNEITELTNTKTRMISTIYKQNALIRSFETFANETQKECKEQINAITKELNETKKSLSNKNQDSESIPVTSWFCSDFPKDLCAQISEIATNNTIKTTTKLKSVLTTIAKYYNSQKLAIEKQGNAERSSLENKVNIISQFVDEVSKAIQNDTITVDAIVYDPSKIYSVANNIQQVYDSLKEKRMREQEFEQVSQELFNILQVDSMYAATEKANTIIQSLKLAAAKADKMKLKYSNAVKAKKQKDAEIEKFKDDQSKIIQEMQEHIEEVLEENKNAVDESHKYQAEIIQLKSKIDELSQTHENELESKNFETKALLEHVKEESAKRIAEEKEAQEVINSKLIDAYSVIDNMKAEAKQMKNRIDVLQKENDQKTSKIVELTLENESTKNDADAEHSREKSEMNENFGKVFDSMKKKNEEQRTMIDKLTNSINDCEKRYKELFDIKSQLEAQNKNAEDSLQLIRDELSREKKLRDSQMKAVILSTEMKAQSFVDDEKAKNEKEMKKLYSFIATQFKQYFDAAKALEGESIKDIILSVRDELETLTTQISGIRRLLGIDENESPVDALSKLLISMFITN